MPLMRAWVFALPGIAAMVSGCFMGDPQEMVYVINSRPEPVRVAVQVTGGGGRTFATEYVVPAGARARTPYGPGPIDALVSVYRASTCEVLGQSQVHFEELVVSVPAVGVFNSSSG